MTTDPAPQPVPLTVTDLAVTLERHLRGYSELEAYEITRMVQPPEPDRCITVTPYGLDRDMVLPPTVVRVQVRTRAPMNDPDETTRTGEFIRGVLESHRAVWGGRRVARCTHLSTGWIGADRTGRLERTDNYTILLIN